jgi:hypothetical protein
MRRACEAAIVERRIRMFTRDSVVTAGVIPPGAPMEREALLALRPVNRPDAAVAEFPAPGHEVQSVIAKSCGAKPGVPRPHP